MKVRRGDEAVAKREGRHGISLCPAYRDCTPVLPTLDYLPSSSRLSESMKRCFVLVLLTFILLPACAQSVRFLPEGRLDAESPAFHELVPENAALEILAEGFDWTEGPVWRADSSYVLFSDIPPNTIYRWKDGEGLSLFLRPAGHNRDQPPGREVGTNGLFIDAEGQLVMADHGDRQISRLNEKNFTKESVAGSYEGKRLNSPNDLVFAKNGNLYFTDPPYGLEGLNDSPVKEQPHNGVYLVRPDGEVVLLDAELTFPNGIILSPDEQTLYVAVSDGRAPAIWAYDVQSDGTVANKRMFFDGAPLRDAGRRGAFDGTAIDVNGNLWATGPGGVLVITPDGELLGTIVTGRATSNCIFGGPDRSVLYITADNYLLRLPTRTTGYVPFE